MKKILSRYAKKTINPKYYGTIKVSAKKLTRAEFEAGEQGLVYLNNETGKLEFDD